jgi:hypothetical protein
MRNIRKSSTLESKFPLLAVEQGCIISKDGDITVAYEVTLPEIFTYHRHSRKATDLQVSTRQQVW